MLPKPNVSQGFARHPNSLVPALHSSRFGRAEGGLSRLSNRRSSVAQGLESSGRGLGPLLPAFFPGIRIFSENHQNCRGNSWCLRRIELCCPFFEPAHPAQVSAPGDHKEKRYDNFHPMKVPIMGNLQFTCSCSCEL